MTIITLNFQRFFKMFRNKFWEKYCLIVIGYLICLFDMWCLVWFDIVTPWGAIIEIRYRLTDLQTLDARGLLVPLASQTTSYRYH